MTGDKMIERYETVVKEIDEKLGKPNGEISTENYESELKKIDEKLHELEQKKKNTNPNTCTGNYQLR
jgi:hypothetical protein